MEAKSSYPSGMPRACHVVHGCKVNHNGMFSTCPVCVQVGVGHRLQWAITKLC